MSTPLLNRRRLMMAAGGYSPSDYIRDGLVFWLDGENIGNTQGYWTDIIGGKLFQLLGDVSQQGNRMRFNGGYALCADPIRFNLATGTFHVCVKFDKIERAAGENYYSNWVIRFSRNDTSSTSAAQNVPLLTTESHSSKGTGFYFMSNSNGCLQFNGQEMTFSKAGIDVNSGLLLNKSTAHSYVGNNYFGLNNSDDVTIARRNMSNSVAFYGEIMCVLFYNRLLTNSEMLHNQQFDNIRFGLGL